MKAFGSVAASECLPVKVVFGKKNNNSIIQYIMRKEITAEIKKLDKAEMLDIFSQVGKE